MLQNVLGRVLPTRTPEGAYICSPADTIPYPGRGRKRGEQVEKEEHNVSRFVF